jgi:polyisoprenoid-binding protein YceI
MKTTQMLGVGLALAASTGFTQTTTWTADKAHSRVMFTVTHMVVSEVTGRFTDFDVILRQPKDDFSDAKVTASIKTASINTDNQTRDNHLRSDDFFNAEKYPEIKFVSTAWEKTGPDTYRIKGDLTMRDVTKPVVLNAKFNGSITDGRGDTKAGFKASTVINRMDYGVKWSRAIEAGGLVVSENVDILLLLELQKQK